MDKLPAGYVYLKHVLNNAVLTKFTKESEIEDWVADYMQLTKTAWSIINTLRSDPAKAKKLVFRRIYHCHLNTTCCSLKTPRQRKHATKNINCPAQLDIYIKCPPRKYSKVDKITAEWPCVIYFKNNHNHTVNNAASLTKRPIGSDATAEIMEYFNRGHSAASAYHSYGLKKMEEFGDRYDTMVMDRYYFPTKNDFGNIWKKYQKIQELMNNGGVITNADIFSTLTENIKKHSAGVLHKFETGVANNRYVLSFCSPIMQRAVRLLNPSSDIMFVDAISNGDVQSNNKLHLFSTQSPAGRIPIGCIISNAYCLKRKKPRKQDALQQQEVFAIGVKNLLDLMPEVNPRVIITDDDSLERTALTQYWPNSTILLCSFRVLKTVWKWLTLPKNNIPVDERQMLYTLFRNILMSKSENDLYENVKIFKNCNQYSQYQEYVEDKLKKIEMWCLYYRQLITRDAKTANNYMQVIFHLFRDIPLERYVTYNLPQLVDYIVTDFESYYKQRIVDVVLGKVNKSILARLYPEAKDIAERHVRDLGDMQFSVSDNSGEDDVVYFVDLLSNICTCQKNSFGKVCRHQAAIIIHSNVDDVCSTLSSEDNNSLYEVATGGRRTEELFLPSEPASCLDIKPEVADIDNSNISDREDESTGQNMFNTVDSNYVKAVKEKWDGFVSMLGDTVKEAIDSDPEGIVPAIEACISSYKQNGTSASTVISSLYNAFKQKTPKKSTSSKKRCKKPTKRSAKPATTVANSKRCRRNTKEIPLPPLVYTAKPNDDS